MRGNSSINYEHKIHIEIAASNHDPPSTISRLAIWCNHYVSHTEYILHIKNYLGLNAFEKNIFSWFLILTGNNIIINTYVLLSL